jgi:polysaccharide biosynthesis PFTS motif protein
VNFLIKITFDLFKGNPINLILSREIVKSSNFLFANDGVLAKDYLFHNSSHIYRPIWTYFAERKGSRILFYFYSTNFKTLNYDTTNYLQENTWFLCTWSNYLVWDKYSADFIRNCTSSFSSKIYIVGPIMFGSFFFKYELPKTKYIVIFDVQPFRESFYCSLGVIHRYYRSEISIKFLMDIIQVCRSYDYQIVLKRKRKVGNLICNKYVTYLESIKNNIYIADENCDINYLISNAKAVISMPFTSTSIWAEFLDVKTIFYDTTGELKFNNNDSHGIDVINNIFDLEKWFKNL